MNESQYPKAEGRRRNASCFLVRLIVPALAAIVAASAMGQPHMDMTVSVHSDSEQRGTIFSPAEPAKARGGQLEVESILVEAPLPSGKRYTAELTLVHEPVSGLFWWHLRGADASTPTDRLAAFRARFAFFVSDKEILGIEATAPPPSLWFLRSTVRVASLDEGQQMAFDSLAKRADAIEKGSARWQRGVSLWDTLPRDFFYHPDHSAPHLELEVVSIAHGAGTWEVVVEGRNERRALVKLDDLFNLIGSELEEEP